MSELIARVSCGDQDAFGRFYDATSRMVFGMALNVSTDRTQAEAMTQEVFVAAWRSAPNFDASVWAPSAWLVSITRKEIARMFRLSAKRSSAGVIS
ncbi:MAG: hypothetical protein H0V07_10595 [Propionibacteriales bacterium]|nr:hypothetical protein [Propionibacteriales bacterium]